MTPPAAQVSSFYWHDYETFGLDTVRDRPAQFAGQRTDAELNPVGEPLLLYCRLADDYLPSPEACLLTGITPQRVNDCGVTEAEFIRLIHDQLALPGTCGVGYNSLRFDDEVTRQALYRNLFDPYAREWRDGNTRWDLLNLVRAAYALRPDGLQWPLREDGTPSFKLEALTGANGIEHGQAHDALADVTATIALARRLRTAQPRLWDYLVGHRHKSAVLPLVDVEGMTPLVHVSGRYPAARGCTALVVPLAWHAAQSGVAIVCDLADDPERWLDLEPEAIAARVFAAPDELPEGEPRIPLKQVRLNRAPVLVPASALRPADAERLGIDLAACQRHRDALRRITDLGQRVTAAFAPPDRPPPADPEAQLYSGPFLGSADRRRLDALRALPPAGLAKATPAFADPRLPELLFRYRARNYPESLDGDERRDWEAFRRRRLTGGEPAGARTLAGYFEELEKLAAGQAAEASRGAVLQALEAYGRQLEAGLG